MFKSLTYGVVFLLIPVINAPTVSFSSSYLINFFGLTLSKLDLIAFLLFGGALAKSAQLGLHT